MVRSEREMVRKLDGLERDGVETDGVEKRDERFTSLQPTYEDSIPPAPDSDWELEQE